MNSFRSPGKVLRRLTLTPLARRELRSWPRFMINYALGLVGEQPYIFRSGARVQVGRGVDHATIVEIFFRRDYGTIPAGSVVLDIGASIGAFTVYAATSAPDVRVYAYEPLPEFARLLHENVRINGLSGAVTCVTAAVAGTATPRDLVCGGHTILFPTLYADGADRTATTVRVPCTTLADILQVHQLARVHVVKMDCEGAEYEILYNTPASCLEKLSEIRMEYHNLDGQTQNIGAMTHFLQDHRYDVTLAAPTTPTSGNLWARRHD